MFQADFMSDSFNGRRPSPRHVVGSAVRLLLCAALLAAGGHQGGIRAQEEPPIAVVLRKAPARVANVELESWLPAVTRFYSKRDFKPAWTTGEGFSPVGGSAIRTLREAQAEGLTPEEYVVPSFIEPPVRRDAAALAVLEVMLSLAVVRYAHDLGWGVTLPSEVDQDNTYAERPFAPDVVLERVVSATDPGAALAAFAPPGVAYPMLKQGLANLRAVHTGGGWTMVSAGPTLRAGDKGPRVQELRTKLLELGDLPAAAPPGDLFDDDLVAALKQFQYRHGLEPDGVYGPRAVADLNVPLTTRIQQLRLGLERLRWLPRAPEGRRIGVNIAAFMAYVFEGDQIVFETRTVVGKQVHATPMFSRDMTYLVINPYWNVPPSITRSEILPKIAKDPDYLARNHMEMEGGSVRQLPGPWNSLGRFKFMFPNPYNIYMHDTPSRALFERADRTGSHGCVRLEKPAELAALLLGPQGWTPERIAAAVATGEQTIVTLTRPIPVYLTYVTAFLGRDNLMHYRRDVYGRDKKLIDALARRGRGAWEE
jgi:murein L,D-transpeptidase YcbB/YkuD